MFRLKFIPRNLFGIVWHCCMHNRFMGLYGNLNIVLLSAANLRKLCAAFRRIFLYSWVVKLTHHFLPWQYPGTDRRFRDKDSSGLEIDPGSRWNLESGANRSCHTGQKGEEMEKMSKFLSVLDPASPFSSGIWNDRRFVVSKVFCFTDLDKDEKE